MGIPKIRFKGYTEDWEQRKFSDLYSKVSEKNDFNLNIPRYVDNFEKEEELDLDELLTSITNTDEEIRKTQAEFLTLLKDLTSTDEEIAASLNNLVEKMEG